MKRLLYIANVRLPTEKAHGIQIMKMCEAFASNDVRVELYIPKRRNFISRDPFAYYNINRIFSICPVRCIDFLAIPMFARIKFAYWGESLSFLIGIKWLLKSKIFHYDVVYTRDIWSIIFFKHRQILVYEVHNLPKKDTWFYRRMLKRIDKFVVLTKGLQDDLMKLGIASNSILIAPDAVDIEQFSVTVPQRSCRLKLGLPIEKKIVLYSGHLYSWKGVYTALMAAQLLPQVVFIFVGGTIEDIIHFRQKIINQNIINVIVFGHTEHVNIPYFLKAANVLLLPNSATEKISERYTSPLKLFEYMASGVPIVASDLPSIREILNNTNAVLVESDNPSVLAKSIKNILQTPNHAQKISSQAFKDVQAYTWQKRAENIIHFIVTES